MTRITKLTLAISAAALSIGGIAYAQMPGEHKSMMDTDGNGTITRAEAQQAATAMFTMMDANKDGKIDTADREAHMAQMRTRMFDMLDTDKSGAVSRDEFVKGDHHAMHEGMDGRDGAGGGPGMAGHDMGGHETGEKGKGGHEHHGRKGGHMGGGHGGKMMMKMADANGDGAVTKDELLAGAMKHFDMADTNKDGQISQQEHDAMREKMKAEWKAMKAAD